MTVTVCLIDTSVFCNILCVPNRDQHKKQIAAEFTEFNNNGFMFLLPMATVIETGNQIGRNGSGQDRRSAADRFVRAVNDAINQEAPWALAPLPDSDAIGTWLAGFPDFAMQGIGLADVTIIEEYNRQRQLHKGRRVFIWSLDQHLSSYDRAGSLG